MALIINLNEGDQIGRLIFTRNLSGSPDWQGTVALVNDTKSDRFFVISGIMSAFDTGRPEIVILPADADGEVIDWIEDACWRNPRNLDEVMWDFSFMLEDEN
jgi:hypothetical protein